MTPQYYVEKTQRSKAGDESKPYVMMSIGGTIPTQSILGGVVSNGVQCPSPTATPALGGAGQEKRVHVVVVVQFRSDSVTV